MSPKEDAAARVAALPIWRGRVTPEPLAGGITNQNFKVEDAGRRYVVRVGDDILVHGVVRATEVAASRAAHLAGLSPGVVHAEPGILVLDFIEGRTFMPEDVRNPGAIENDKIRERMSQGTPWFVDPAKFDEAVERRDREYIRRLKALYGSEEGGW